MVFWVKRFAAILGITVFFMILFLNLSSGDPFNPNVFIPAILRALIGGALFWFAAFIIGDILFKGIVSDIETDENCIIEGGLLQQIAQKQEKSIPGGGDLPFTADMSSELSPPKKNKK